VNHIRIPSAPHSKNRIGTPGAHTMPDGWSPKNRTLAKLAKELGVTADEVAEQYVKPFIVKATSDCFMYRNWDTAEALQ
jgi:hypothetical protein